MNEFNMFYMVLTVRIQLCDDWCLNYVVISLKIDCSLYPDAAYIWCFLHLVSRRPKKAPQIAQLSREFKSIIHNFG